MVSINYHRLFNLKVSHSFYTDELAKGVALVPTTETGTLLKGGKMIMKYLPQQMVVLFKGEDDNPANPFIDLGDDFKLVFALVSNNKSEFVNITNLDEGLNEYEAGKFLYFKNNPAAASPETITHTLIDSLKSNLFTYSFELAPATGTVDFNLFKINDDATETLVSSGKDANGNPLPTTVELDQDPKNRYNHSVNIRPKALGRYKIVIEPNGGGAPLLEELLYINPDMASQKPLGVVEIIYDSVGRAYGATEDYDIHFEAKDTKWMYHIVNKSGNLIFPADTLNIIHPDFLVVPGGSSPHPSIQVNNKPTVVITSDNFIGLTESPTLNIELQRDSDNQVYIEHLPNPAVNSNVSKEGLDLTSKIYVYL